MADSVRPAIVVDPAALEAAAAALRQICEEARRVQREMRLTLSPETGSASLTEALADHAAAWGPTIEMAEDTVRQLAELLAASAATYTETEKCLGVTVATN